MIRYRYSGEPMRLEDRFVNPLGFEVLRYRRDAEALPPQIEEAPPPSGEPVAVKPVVVVPVPVQGGPAAPPPSAPPARPEPEL